jgi:hypothetical protein
MTQITHPKTKSIWKQIPIIGLFIMIFNNSFLKRFGDENQLIFTLVVLLISLGATFLWMREDKKNGVLKKGKVTLMICMLTASLLIGGIGYFLK